MAGRNDLAGDRLRCYRRMMVVVENSVRSNGVMEVRRRAPQGSRGLPRRASRVTESARVDIVAPDRFCAGLLVELIGSTCPFELVGTGPGWVVRLQQRSGMAWEADLLLLVQRWLEACPLPCARIVCGGRRYLLRLAISPGQEANMLRSPVSAGGDR